MSAFYCDKHWKSFWHGKPLEEIIADCTARLPWKLAQTDPLKRHQKVVDESTKDIVGYARWILPENMANAKAWPEAGLPEVDHETKREFKENYDSFMDENGLFRGLDHQMVQKLSVSIDHGEEEVKKSYGERFLGNTIYNPLCLASIG